MIHLDVGGVLYTTTVAALRSHPGSMLDVMVSDRFMLGTEEDGTIFLDRDGSLFGHVLAYLRDGVVAVRDVSLLNRLKREFNFYCIDLEEAQTLVLAVGGRSNDSASIQYDPSLSHMENFNYKQDSSWTTGAHMREQRQWFAICAIDGSH